MKCPRCHACVHPLENSCSACGFNAGLLHSYLGNQWVRLERITDAAHCLRLEDARKVEVILDDFERSFPQAFFASYLGVLPKVMGVSELGFWLLNQGAFNTHSVDRRNDFGIVFVVDPATHNASLSLGYSIEALLRADALTHTLSVVGNHLKRGAYGVAIESACLGCAKLLKKHARAKCWNPAASPSAGLAPDMGLQPLRGGHRPASRTRNGPFANP